MLFTEPAWAHPSLLKLLNSSWVLAFRAGYGSCPVVQDRWVSLRVYGSNVCCGLGFGTFRLFCLWTSVIDLKTVSPCELSRKESCCIRRVFWGLQCWHWKAQSWFFLWFLHFFLSMQLPMLSQCSARQFKKQLPCFNQGVSVSLSSHCMAGHLKPGWCSWWFVLSTSGGKMLSTIAVSKVRCVFLLSLQHLHANLFFLMNPFLPFTGIWTLRMGEVCERIL